VTLTLSSVAVGDELPMLGYDVTPTTVVLGALASRDWRPMHHDFKFATERNGVRDIFLNTPNQAAWFERYITDWTGPRGRLGRMKFRMHDSVFPGDHMVFSATVADVMVDARGQGLGEPRHPPHRRRSPLHVVHRSRGAAISPADNPWSRHGDDWQP